MKKLHIEKCQKIITKAILFSIIILATLSVIYYAKGYRINLTDQKIIKTGVLHIETQPRRAHFYISDEINGRTSKTISSIPEGNYSLSLWLEEYHDLKYEVYINAERSTLISSLFIKETPEYETIEDIEKEIVQTYKGPTGSIIFILTKENRPDKKEYELLKYQANMRFWQLNKNPEIIYTFSTANNTEIQKLMFSENNNFAIMQLESEEKTKGELLDSGTYILSFTKEDILTKIEPSPEKIKWSKDELSLLWQEKNDILKLNIEDIEEAETVFKANENTETLHYETDRNGTLYILHKDDLNPFASLTKIGKNNQESILLEEIFFRMEDLSLDKWREKPFIEYQTFTNAPQSTIFVGKPTEFKISLETDSIFFSTEKALYKYNLEENKYILINPNPSKIIDISPDQHKLTFLDLANNKLGVFIFDREPGDYSVKLGTYYISEDINQEDCSDFLWHQNSRNIFYVCSNTLYTVDMCGFNKIEISKNIGNHFLIEGSQKITTIMEKEDTPQIVEITIN